jgi:hypothetical protein
VAEDAPTDQDSTAPEASASADAPTLKGRRAFSRMRREMTDEELDNSGVRKIMMDDVDRLEAEKSDLLQYVDKYHAADKENAVLKEKAKVKVASDIAFGIFTTVGGAAAGYSPSLNAVPHASSMVLYAGVILIFAGIASKVALK